MPVNFFHFEWIISSWFPKNIIGVDNSKKLLEDIPNKFQNKLGIVADVNLLTKGALEYIEIVVNPWAFPVNYGGEYHYRSGRTKQQLRGNALTNFLMAKTGLKWDAATVSNVSVSDLHLKKPIKE